MIESGSTPLIPGAEGLQTPPETTGRFIVVFAEGTDTPAHILRDAAGISDVVPARELREDKVPKDTSQSINTVFEELGMAVVSAGPDQLGALRTSADAHGNVMSVSPELVHHVRDSDYVRGYVEGVGDLGRRLGVSGASMAPHSQDEGSWVSPQFFRDTTDLTWGIQATGADVSTWSGQGIAVAVLDTGFDDDHPDFAGRAVTMKSFVPGESAQDGHGHGTHCIGTACGPKSPSTGPRYGVAHGADIFVGKVLSDGGSGTDGGILAGIDWAVGSGCAVISMSLGADIPRTHPPYTVAGQRALDKGSLIVAAAGNNAMRTQLDFGFVGAPANSPFILAVGALNQQLDVAFFSARTLADTRGGQVDAAGPGYQIYSSWPMPTRYRTISGTSMATPHVSGLAALHAEASGYRGRELWSVLAQESRRLLAPSLDVGFGLVLAP